ISRSSARRCPIHIAPPAPATSSVPAWARKCGRKSADGHVRGSVVQFLWVGPAIRGEYPDQLDKSACRGRTNTYRALVRPRDDVDGDLLHRSDKAPADGTVYAADGYSTARELKPSLEFLTSQKHVVATAQDVIRHDIRHDG